MSNLTLQYAVAFKNALFNDLGIEAPKVLSFDESYKKLPEVSISPKMLGPMGCAFDKVTVEIAYGVNKGTLYLRYDYNWVFENGATNGYVMTREIKVAE